VASKTNSSKGKLDVSTVAGIVLALAGIVGGLILEGGRFSDVSSITAAMIVVAGTLGAVMITTPMPQLMKAGRSVTGVFWDSTPSNEASIEQILQFARQARRNGLTSLESEVEQLSEPFLKKALSLAVDGADLQDIRRIMELEIELADHRGESAAKVFETAGGYSPTIGIIGAVLGLIQVMKHLEDIERVGHGIAVAFIATVYGVAFANLFLLPAGAKLRARLESRLKNHELVLEGVLSLAEGMNPMLIKSKLEAYIEGGSAQSAAAPSHAPVSSESRSAA
jgi:chemotaxis protein MotA